MQGTEVEHELCGQPPVLNLSTSHYLGRIVIHIPFANITKDPITHQIPKVAQVCSIIPV